ncbi:hypothetical protein [uncultured Ruthenibacterium sp.]|uniref:hypothetical protein n=1 Tax=uncultured Ruthenibacterium sp. TaxID=1905347 RepID=UPI00349E5ECE
MGLFNFNLNKEGPGVPKDAPKKKGAARFFEIFTRDFSQIWLSNLLLLVCAVPMITAVLFSFLFWQYLGVVAIAAVVFLLSNVLLGPALASMHTILVKQLCDEPCFFWHEYKKAWKSCWKQAIPVSMLFSAICGMECAAGIIHLLTAEKPSAILLGMVLLGLYIAVTSWLYATIQLTQMDMKIGPMLKNSLLLTMGFLKRSLPAGLVILVSVTVLVGFIPWPITFLLAMVGVPAIVALVADMWAWPVIEQVFHISELRAERREKQRAEEEAAAQV